MIGSSGEGVWNEEGATFAFAIVPLFYETWWFLALACGLAASAGAVDFRATVDGHTRLLKPFIADEVGRIAREALVNAYRHARARSIDVHLLYDPSRFQCTVRDAGRGIDQAVLDLGRDGHWGLIGMRERAERIGSELHMRSSATAGTEVVVSIAGELAYAEGRGPSRSLWSRFVRARRRDDLVTANGLVDRP